MPVLPRSASEIDSYIGSKIRGYRNQQGISQMELGDMLGISFQQVQKYEKGINRVSGARMEQLAQIFKVEVSDLLPGRPKSKKSSQLTNVDRMVASRDGSKLVDSFVTIKSANLREALVDLARRFEGQ